MKRIDELWRYDGRRALVTGCGSGIGAEVVRQLTELGAEVVGLDVRRGSSEAHEFHEVDLADPGSIERVLSSVSGPVDALFNVAGVSSGIGDPRRVVATNFLGLRHLTGALAERMPSGSAIVNVSSQAASGYRENHAVVAGLLATRTIEDGLAWCDGHPAALADGGCYRVSKQAIIFYTMSEAPALAARGIRINCTAPGVTETPILNDTRAAFGQAYLDDIPKPLGRVAEPAEQAAILVFLNSRAASYLSGEVLWVDGGLVNGRVAAELLSAEARD